MRRNHAYKPSPDAIPCSQPTHYHVHAAALRTAFEQCCSFASLVTPSRCRCLAGAVQEQARAQGAEDGCLHEGNQPALLWPLVSLLHSVRCQTCHADMCAGDRTCAQPTACMMRDSTLLHPVSGLNRSRAHTFLRHQSDRARPNAKSSASLFVACRCVLPAGAHAIEPVPSPMLARRETWLPASHGLDHAGAAPTLSAGTGTNERSGQYRLVASSVRRHCSDHQLAVISSQRARSARSRSARSRSDRILLVSQ